VPIHRHEVDELLDTAGQCGLDVCDGGHGPEDAGPGAGDVAVVGVVPADAGQHPRLPVLAAGDARPRADAADLRPHRLPHVDVRVADDPPGAGPGRVVHDATGQPRFLRALDHVIGQHADAVLRVGGELRDPLRQVV